MGTLDRTCKSVRCFLFCFFGQKIFICDSQSRNPPIVPLSLTLSECPLPPEALDSTPTLYHVLSLIFPLVTTLPLSLDILNNSLSCPEYRDEDLHSGWLQLPRGSTLILTESSVAEGSIFNQGSFHFLVKESLFITESRRHDHSRSTGDDETPICGIHISVLQLHL